MIVVKFGGTSLADANQIRKAAQIVKSDPQRQYVVVSAPGKRNKEDTKVTDLLYQCYHAAIVQGDWKTPFQILSERFVTLKEELGLTLDVQAELEMIAQQISIDPQEAYIASRGEYLNAKIMAEVLGYTYIEAQETIFFDEHHHFLEEKTYQKLGEVLKKYDHAVIGGFYGCGPDGEVVTFSRGGSDITGAIAARSVHADLYENWTDVNGFRTADPRIVPDAKGISWISYRELRELSYMGASVLHEDAVFPIRSVGIPLQIRNTNEPDHPGTLIASGRQAGEKQRVIAGIAGKKGLSNLQLEKAMMNTEVGFGAKVLEIIARFGIPYEHTPTSIDTMSVLVETKDIEPVKDALLEELDRCLHPDRVFLQDHIALAAVVGEGMNHHLGIASELLGVLAQAGINIRMIDLGFSEMTIILGIDEEDYEKAIHAVYHGLHRYF